MVRFNAFSCYDIISLVVAAAAATVAAARTANCFDTHELQQMPKMRFIIVFEFVISNLHVYLNANSNKIGHFSLPKHLFLYLLGFIFKNAAFESKSNCVWILNFFLLKTVIK